MRHFAIITALLAVLAASLPLAASTLQVEAVYTTTRQVTSLAVTDQAVWVGTTGGCLRWDPQAPVGYKYTTADGLPGNHVTGIIPGPSNATVIIATTHGIAACRDRRGGLRPWQGMSVLAGRATALTRADGEVYACIGRQTYVLQLSPEAGEWVALGPPLVAEPRCLAWHDGGLWAGTGNGLFRLEGDRWQPLVHSENPLAANVNALLASGDDFYVATVGGLFRLLEGHWHHYTTADGLPDSHITALAAGADGIYLGTFGGGLATLAEDAIAAVAGSPAYVSTVAVGPSPGTLWVGTQHHGAWLWDGQSWSRQVERNEPPGSNITGIAINGSELWVGTFEHGVGLLRDSSWRAFGSASGLGSDWINHLAYGHGRAWARTSAGELFSYHHGTWQQVTKRSGLLKDWTSSVQAAGGNIWVGTWGALSKFDGKKWHNFAPKPALTGQVVTSVAVLDRDIWVGTAKAGLCRYDGQARTWQAYTLGSGLTDTWVTCLEVWRGCLWIGTFSGGLCKYEKGNWEHFRAADVLPGDRINCLAHGDRLYVGTLEGLCSYDGRTWQTYGREAGLPSEVIQSLQLSSDGATLWVGTPAGLARVSLPLAR